MEHHYFTETGIPDLLIFEPRIWADERGYFYESYSEQLFAQHGLSYCFVQDNQARSTRGVLRGLHFQREPYAQTKLVRVTEGSVFDVAVDLRKGSPTEGKWFGLVLSADNHKQLLVPRGFAHGYLVLSETAVFVYKCDNFYAKAQEGGLIYNDPTVGIEWPMPASDLLISAKDAVLPQWGGVEHNFVYK